MTSFSYSEETNNKEILIKQIAEVVKKKEIFDNNNCNIPEEEQILREYESDHKKIVESLGLAKHLITVNSALLSNDGFFDNAIAKSLNLGSLEESLSVESVSKSKIIRNYEYPDIIFSYNGLKIKARYRNRKEKNNDPGLISLEVIYPDTSQVYLDFTHFRQAHLRVYKKVNSSSGKKDNEALTLQLLFNPFHIGTLEFLSVLYNNVPRYEYVLTYGFRCFDANYERITPTQKSSARLTPNYLLWYDGSIGEYPIKFMLKREFNKESKTFSITDIVYGYKSQKKWIQLQNIKQSEKSIIADENEENNPLHTIATWELTFEMDSLLNGIWSRGQGHSLPIKLIPSTKELPKFLFQAEIEKTLTPRKYVSYSSVTALNIYYENKIIIK